MREREALYWPSPKSSSSLGRKVLTSIKVFPSLRQRVTHLSSLNTTLHTAPQGSDNSLTKSPVRKSIDPTRSVSAGRFAFRRWRKERERECVPQSLILPSLPPVTMNLSSTCKQVTELSCAHNRWIVSKVERSKTITRPSEPPVIKVGGVAGADAEEGDEGRRTSWPTREVWPWRRARNSLEILVNWRVSSNLQETITRDELKLYPVSALQILTVESREPVTTRIPSNATA